jgi:hypothetical protein
MSILAKALFTLMLGDLCALTFFTTGHSVSSMV